MVLTRLDDDKKFLVEQNMKLVYKVAHDIGIPQSATDFDDIVQEGCLGLMFAAENYNSEISKFSTYACSCIKYAIMSYLTERKTQEERFSCVKFDDIVPNTDDMTFGDVIPAKEETSEAVDIAELRRITNCALGNMGTEKTRRVVRYYLDGVFEHYAPTYKFIASKFGVSKQWVSAIMAKYRKQLFMILRREGYDVPVGRRVDGA